MKHHGITILLLLAAITLAAEDIEIAPRFAGWERGCVAVAAPAMLLRDWGGRQETGRFPAVPSQWRDVAGKPRIFERRNHWLAQLPLEHALFHGIRVIRYDQWHGKENCISGWRLVLDAPIDAVRRVIDERTFELDATGTYKPKLVADGERTRLLCSLTP